MLTNVALYVFLCVVWGSTWLVIKVGYGGLGPFNAASVRFFVAAAILIPLVPSFRARWPGTATEWALVVWVGVVLFGVDYGLIYWAEQFIDSGLTAVLFATLPVFTAFLAHFYLPGEPMTPRKLAGTLLALLGVVALFGGSVRLDVSKAGPMLAVVSSAVCAAAAGVAAKRHGASLHPAALNAPAMLIGALVLLMASFAAGDGFRVPQDTETWGAIAYLAVVGSVISFLVFFSLLQRWSATSLSFISVFMPVVALLLGFVVLDERPTVWTVLGAVLILVGVILALTRARRISP
jgi:drug/metabolite transporter (DMT)-like permease